MNSLDKLRLIVRQLLKEEVDELQNHIFNWLDSKFNEKNIERSFYKTPTGTSTFIISNNDIIFKINFDIENEKTSIEVNDKVLQKFEKYFFTNRNESYEYLKSWFISRHQLYNIINMAPYQQVKYNDDVEPDAIDYSKY